MTSRRNLARFIYEQFCQLDVCYTSCESIISGGALGFDQGLAAVAKFVHIPYTLAIPFESHGSNWPKESRDYYQILVRSAATVVNVGGGGKSRNAQYLARDRWMVDNCSCLLALWDGKEEGGTWKTVAYAREKGVKIHNLYEAWLRFKDTLTT